MGNFYFYKRFGNLLYLPLIFKNLRAINHSLTEESTRGETLIYKTRIILSVPFMLLAVFFKTIFIAILPAKAKEEGKNII